MSTGEAECLSKQLTVVIPTYERHELLRCSLEYWSTTGASIVVADGSRGILPSSMRSGSQYLHVPPTGVAWEHVQSNYLVRILEALRAAQTPFVALCGDDDLFLPSALHEAIGELNSPSQVTSVVGRTLSFAIAEDLSVCWGVRYGSWRAHPALSDNRLHRRVKSYTGRPFNEYSICKRQSLTVLYEAVQELSQCLEFRNTQDLGLTRRFLARVVFRTKFLDRVLWIRAPKARLAHTAFAEDHTWQYHSDAHFEDRFRSHQCSITQIVHRLLCAVGEETSRGSASLVSAELERTLRRSPRRSWATASLHLGRALGETASRVSSARFKRVARSAIPSGVRHVMGDQLCSPALADGSQSLDQMIKSLRVAGVKIDPLELARVQTHLVSSTDAYRRMSIY